MIKIEIDGHKRHFNFLKTWSRMATIVIKVLDTIGNLGVCLNFKKNSGKGTVLKNFEKPEKFKETRKFVFDIETWP